ncbi:flagellar biosynthesis protein FlhB [Rosenbergiella australiborealis]|uniref:Flagellar biosynthetic protein FlhB n=1 Tax=Rosenbergiella australiborealis TaxID=1544696 RepID=A0ABS5T5C0_9GAMM|nr:flagellar biosynthesis protein FlhB [Rosenbergiella australiborealis]MBT0727549.1 flagellar type III secretion system protein FlhB [Rosenbergiella australiborealis]
MSQASDKTEKATPTKLKKAREKGDAGRAKELSSAASLAIAFITLLILTPWYWHLIGEFFQRMPSQLSVSDRNDALLSLLGSALQLVLMIVLSFCGVPLVAGLVALLSGGWIFSLHKLIPDIKRLNPLTGIARLVAVDNLIELAKVLVKSVIILSMLGVVLRHSLADIMLLSRLSWPIVLAISLKLAATLFGYFVLLMCGFALIEWPLSRYQFQRKMKMSRQEVKDEFKNTEGNPQIKGRLRQLQRQIAQGQLRKTVPQANVIITNPTHYAVALKYDPNAASAPYVVAKGIDDLALYIRQLGEEHAIEVVEFPPLARAVYASTRVNQQIPHQLYQAIAHVLTYVMQLRRWRENQSLQKPRINQTLPLPAEGQFSE